MIIEINNVKIYKELMQKKREATNELRNFKSQKILKT